MTDDFFSKFKGTGVGFLSNFQRRIIFPIFPRQRYKIKYYFFVEISSYIFTTFKMHSPEEHILSIHVYFVLSVTFNLYLWSYFKFSSHICSKVRPSQEFESVFFLR